MSDFAGEELHVFFGVDVEIWRVLDIVGVTLWLLFFDTSQRHGRSVTSLFRPSVPILTVLSF